MRLIVTVFDKIMLFPLIFSCLAYILHSHSRFCPLDVIIKLSLLVMIFLLSTV